MIIHSISPIHFLLEQAESHPVSVQQIDGGYLEGYHSPQGFHASRLHSTNPALYLKNEYAPGSILRRQTHC